MTVNEKNHQRRVGNQLALVHAYNTFVKTFGGRNYVVTRVQFSHFLYLSWTCFFFTCIQVSNNKPEKGKVIFHTILSQFSFFHKIWNSSFYFDGRSQSLCFDKISIDFFSKLYAWRRFPRTIIFLAQSREHDVTMITFRADLPWPQKIQDVWNR